jgi:hypothetical protein
VVGVTAFQNLSYQNPDTTRTIGSRNISTVDHVEGEALGIQESEFQKVRKLSVVDFHGLQNPEE